MADSLKVNKKALHNELQKLMAEAYTIDDAGNPITRATLLAKMIWDKALGYIEEYRDDTGKKVKKVHPPESWAQQFLFERLEGKAAQAATENETGVKAVDKVRELARDRLNKLVSKVAGPPAMKS